MLTVQTWAANTKVKAAQTGSPPEELQVVKDLRTNPRTRKQLIEGFWKAQRGISGHVAYVGNETDRERLRRQGKVMVLISDLSAQHVNVIGPTAFFEHA